MTEHGIEPMFSRVIGEHSIHKEKAVSKEMINKILINSKIEREGFPEGDKRVSF